MDDFDDVWAPGPAGLSCAVGAALNVRASSATTTFVVAGGYNGLECLDGIHLLHLTAAGTAGYGGHCLLTLWLDTHRALTTY
jgi:hypothetical protein